MIDRKTFFDRVRRDPFDGALKPSQVAGMSAIMDEWERRKLSDLRWLAYMLATTFHETARTMRPIAEYGKGKGRKYGVPDATTGQVYYGRGFVQLTWLYNYEKATDAIGVDFVNKPDLVMEPDHAAAIMFDGMIDGWFTGKKLADYFKPAASDWVNARRIINGLDQANAIAASGRLFHAALVGAAQKPVDAPKLVPAPSPVVEPEIAPAPTPAPAKSLWQRWFGG